MDYSKQEAVGILQENQRNMTIKQEGQKSQQYLCAVVASIGALIIGSILAWTTPALPELRNVNSTSPLHIGFNNSAESWIASWTPIGAIFGALPAGYFADLLGRKLTLIGFCIPWIITWIVTALSSNLYLLYLARFVSGIIVGLFCTVLPMYVTEIAEDSVRGTLGTLFQVFLTIGILIDYALASFKSYQILNYTCTLITIVFLGLLFFIPESPTYLMKKNRKGEAEQCLRRLRGPHYDVSSELNALRKAQENSQQQKLSLRDTLTPVNIKALFISLMLMVFQQFSGVNAVIFFAGDIFKAALSGGKSEGNAGDAGDAGDSAILYPVILGIVQTSATIASSILVDKAGRKILLIISSAGMAVCLVALGYYFHLKLVPVDVSSLWWLPLISLMGFITVFSLGFGPLPWMMSGEILGPEIKSVGSGCSVATNWISVAIVTYSFNILNVKIGTDYCYWLFAVVCVIAVFFTVILVPETKGKSIHEIQSELAGVKTVKRANGTA